MLHSALKTSLLALLLGAPLAAQAADLYETPGPYQAPPYQAPPYQPPYGGPYGPPAAYPPAHVYGPPPVMREQFAGGFAHCRIFHRVRMDPYGREVLHRVRVCDERVAQRGPDWAPPHARFGYGGPVYDAPRPARDIGPNFDDE